MKKLTRNETAQFLRERDHYVILTHRRPDGDTLGSAAALCLLLRKIGKTAHVLHNPEAFPRLSWLVDDLSREVPEEGDCLISVDVASDDMLPKAFKQYQNHITLRIDHHATATPFTPMELVDPSSAATGEMIYELLMEMGAEMTKEIGWRIYIAITTDTGCFRYSNTTAHTYRVAAACAETGADLYPITQELFDTTSISELKLQNWMAVLG